MSQDEFTRLYVYMTRRFDAIDLALESKADKIAVDRLFGLYDSLDKRLETVEVEQTVMGHQLTRIEGRLGNVEWRLIDVEGRLGDVEENMGELVAHLR